MPQSNDIKLASLFSGCGGLDLGFVNEGYRSIGAFDTDSVAVEHFRANVSPEAYVADLSAACGAVSSLRPSVVVAGPPCQGFSTAGRRDLEDSRNHLLPLAGILAIRMKPKAIVVENVASAQSGAHSRYWTQLESILRTAGYRTNTQKWNAADMGLAQSRRRLFLFAWKGKRDPSFEMQPFIAGRLDETLSGVEQASGHNPSPLLPESKLYKIAARIGPGQKLCNVRGGPRSVHTWHIPEVFGPTTARECHLLELIMRLRRQERERDFGDADPVCRTRLRKELGSGVGATIATLLAKGYLCEKGRGVDLTHSYNGKCRRFRWDDISCAVDTRFGDPHLFLHPNEHRPFTVREAARIQGFPDSFQFTGGDKDSFRLIGNAVPPPRAQYAARILKPVFER